MPFISSGQEDPAWRPAIKRAWLYRASCFTYSITGLSTILIAPTLTVFSGPCCTWFPWWLLGLSVALNGLVSWMADVHTWGCPREHPWKQFDVVMASINTVLQLVVLALQLLGPMSLPPELAVVFTAGLGTSLLCKWHSAACLNNGDCEGFLFWHTGWHIFHPAGCVFSQWLLVSFYT